MKYGNKVLSLSKQFFLLNFFENGVCDSRSLKNYYFFCLVYDVRDNIYEKKINCRTIPQINNDLLLLFPLKRLLEIQSSSLQELLTFFVV